MKYRLTTSIVALLLLMILVNLVSASVPADKVIYDGFLHRAYLYPDAIKDMKDKKDITREEIAKKYGKDADVLGQTKGYFAKWEIKNNELFLIELKGIFERRDGLAVAVKATWYSGELYIPHAHKRALKFTFENGNQVNKKLISTKHIAHSIPEDITDVEYQGQEKIDGE